MDAADVRLPEISDHHARGLRRDLFRELADHRERHRRVLDARLAMVAMPLRGARERRGSYLRAGNAIADACFGFVASDGFVSGVLIEPCMLVHPVGEEPALSMTTVFITMGRQYWRLTRLDAGRVSHHVVERMFQRLLTTRTAEVRDELAVAFSWARLLQVELAFAVEQAGIVEMAIPSPRGALLARWNSRTRQFNARTWLRRGMNARIDASVAALEQWRTCMDPELRAEAFATLANAPEHAWWRRPRVRCPGVSGTRVTPSASHSGHPGC